MYVYLTVAYERRSTVVPLPYGVPAYVVSLWAEVS